MPFAFPSHQGLIAPLWRFRPELFDVPAMFIGAAMPDVIDGIIGAGRGHLGQGLGHSLIALPLLCIPLGLVFWWITRKVACHWTLSKHNGFLARAWNAGLASVHHPGARRTCQAVRWLSLDLAHFPISLTVYPTEDLPGSIPGCPKAGFFPPGGMLPGTNFRYLGIKNPIPSVPILLCGYFWGLWESCCFFILIF